MPQVDAQQILAENAVWQSQVIEAFGICPFARQCRLEGRLHRVVIAGTHEALPDALLDAVMALHRAPDEAAQPESPAWEIALLLCPQAGDDARRFEQLVRQVDARLRALLRARGWPAQYHLVAFHPQMKYSDADPQKLVGFWRRSPHPTLQMVQIATLDRLRSGTAAPRYVDSTDSAAVAALLGQAVTGDLADRIALANWRTYQAHGADLRDKVAQFQEHEQDG